jgi:hypothetical protein
MDLVNADNSGWDTFLKPEFSAGRVFRRKEVPGACLTGREEEGNVYLLKSITQLTYRYQSRKHKEAKPISPGNTDERCTGYQG